MCNNCYHLYINKYEYKKCPQCREIIIKEIKIQQDNIETQFICKKLYFKLLFIIMLLLLSIFIGAYITKDKKFNSLPIDFFIGFLFFSIVFICFIRIF